MNSTVRGGIIMNTSKEKLFQLIKKKALFKGRIVLSSGKVSRYYIDARLVTLSAKGAFLVADTILDLINKKKIDAIGGPTIGADPILGAIAAISQARKCPIDTFIVRRIPKQHGRMRQIEGPVLKKGSRVILIDDVATTGTALIEAKKVLSRGAVKVSEAIVLIDRGEGAKQSLAKTGLRLISIFKAADFGL